MKMMGWRSQRAGWIAALMIVFVYVVTGHFR
jgi:hypothetical protein